MNPLSRDRTSLNRQDLVASSVDVRVEIYNSITKNPGIRYRELLPRVVSSHTTYTLFPDAAIGGRVDCDIVSLNFIMH